MKYWRFTLSAKIKGLGDLRLWENLIIFRLINKSDKSAGHFDKKKKPTKENNEEIEYLPQTLTF